MTQTEEGEKATKKRNSSTETWYAYVLLCVCVWNIGTTFGKTLAASIHRVLFRYDQQNKAAQ